jgi:TPP-dependent indolepyruvate ferredoxin oxidoreductase alpha subunit
MEVQVTERIGQLQLGDGGTFHGEGILAITKALLQSGVAYVGGYQGAPVSHPPREQVVRFYRRRLGSPSAPSAG